MKIQEIKGTLKKSEVVRILDSEWHNLHTAEMKGWITPQEGEAQRFRITIIACKLGVAHEYCHVDRDVEA